MSSIAVTGASGFIGSHLVDHLLEHGDGSVIGIDLWCSDEAAVHVNDARYRFVKADVRDRAKIHDLLEGVDVVVHLASILGTSETVSLIDPVDVAQTNVVATLGLLEELKAGTFGKLVYPSTPDVPWLNPYRITKQASEKFCQMYAREFGLDAVVLGLGNVYGPRERWTGAPSQAIYNYEKVVPTFVVQALRGEPFTIYGDGEQSATYVFIDDAIEALFQSIGAPRSIAGQLIPIARPEALSVNEVAQAVLEVTETQVELQYGEMRRGEVKVHIQPDIRPAMDLLGFEATTDFHTGLEKTVPYYAEVLGSP